MLSRRLTICGSFGCGNAGDEVIPIAIANMARSRGVELEVSLLTRFDRVPDDRVLSTGAHDAERVEALRGQPLIMVGGGIVEPNSLSVANRCGRFLRRDFASRAGLFAVHAERFGNYGIIGSLRTFATLAPLPMLTTRDTTSADVLSRLLPTRPVRALGDVALWMHAGKRPSEIANLGRYVAVALAPRWTEPKFVDWAARNFSAIAREMDAALVFVPMSVVDDDDRDIHRSVVQRMEALGIAPEIVQITRDLPHDELTATFGDSCLTIAMRLHACVFAFSQRTPFVAIGYHPKVHAFARTVGWGDKVVPSEPGTPNTPGVYGLTFGQTGLSALELVSRAREAIKCTTFDELDACRDRLAQALASFLL